MEGTQLETTQAQAHGMVTGRRIDETFSATLERLRAQERSKVDVVVNTADHLQLIAPVEDGAARLRLAFSEHVPHVGGSDFSVIEHAHRQIASRTQVPWNFYDRLRNDHPDVLVNTMNTLWSREPEQRLVRTFVNGERTARAWLSDRYRVVDNLPFLTAALEEAERHGAQVVTAHVDETRLYVKLLTPRQTDVAKGDPIQAGVIISNSEVGDGKVSVSPFVMRLVCTNGMVAAQNYSKMHLGASLDDGIQSAETQEKESAWIFSAIQDWIKHALAEDNLSKIAAAFQRSQEVRIDTSAKLAVANVVRHGGLSKVEAGGVLDRYLRADNDSQFTLVNAVTHLAHSGTESYRRQVELEELGGKLLDMQAQEFTRLVGRSLSDKELIGAFGAN